MNLDHLIYIKHPQKTCKLTALFTLKLKEREVEETLDNYDRYE